MTLSDSRQALLAFVVILALCNSSFGYQLEVLIPANTKVSIELLSPISTGTGKKGDKFTCKVLTPAEYSGAIVEGHIRSSKRSGKADKVSKIDLAFDRITFVDGRLGDFNATVVEVFDVAMVNDQGRADNEGVIRNKSTTVKTSIKRAAVGALIGAIVGGAIAGGQGAAVGAAIGAGLGVTTTLATKGPDLEFKTGTQFTVETNGPVHRRLPKPGESPAARPPAAPQPMQPQVILKKPIAEAATANTVEGHTSVGAPTGAYKQPPLPSTSLKILTASDFTIAVPANWVESSKDPMVVGPEGTYKLENGRPEFTHGAMLGVVDVGRRDLREASERFIEALLRGNPYLSRSIASAASAIGLRVARLARLSGQGKEGWIESVTVYTTILADGRLMYVITVVPESEATLYAPTFEQMVQSVQLKK